MISYSHAKTREFAVRGLGKVFCGACYAISNVFQDDIDKGCCGFQCQECWQWNMIKTQPYDVITHRDISRRESIE